MDGLRGEKELLAAAYRSALDFYDQVADVSSISFVSMGTGVYKWPVELAAKIAVEELTKSKFEVTSMCVVDEETRAIYQHAFDTLVDTRKRL